MTIEKYFGKYIFQFQEISQNSEMFQSDVSTDMSCYPAVKLHFEEKL